MAAKKAAKKKVTTAVLDAHRKRIVLLARRWARHVEALEVLASPSHHLLRAVQKLEALEGGA